MDIFKGNQAKLLLLAVIAIAFAALNPDFTKRLFSRMRATTGTEATSTESPSPTETPVVSQAQTAAQSTVESYMRKRLPPQATLSFLDWSDFANSAQTSAVTLRYRIQNPSQQNIAASVRFTIQAGNVIKTETIPPRVQPMTTLAMPPAPVYTRAPVVIDHFSAPLFAAMHGGSMTLHLDSAFSLSQLEQAKATAQAERKPLGFIMVWGQFFDHEASPQSRGSDAALVHFYEGFHSQLVLVFVRHETELGMVSNAVKRGFNGPDEGGFAPNMAVVDATAREFIVEIPFRDLDAAGRDQLFTEGGRKIDQWLATHPAAVTVHPAVIPVTAADVENP